MDKTQEIDEMVKVLITDYIECKDCGSYISCIKKSNISCMILDNAIQDAEALYKAGWRKEVKNG